MDSTINFTIKLCHFSTGYLNNKLLQPMKCLKASVLPEKLWRNNNNQVIVSSFSTIGLGRWFYLFSLFAVVKVITIYGKESKCVQTTTRLNLAT